MSTTCAVVTLIAAAMVGFSAVSVFLRAQWVVRPIADYGIPMSWLPWLGTAKAAGAAGLVAGLFVPVVGVVAGIALVAYFAGAVVTVVRARWYAHIPFPLMYAAPVVGALALSPAAW
ncbi:DoxX family protein [Streptomyces sp. KL118A]|uniref:DoxX family protein n=1 Tax=Streptomyces sp. KL118A TaxID=3045153 RepID=UPI00278BE6D6|nr:DoxX family protein [Streptomyces sp. KL118A]